MKVVFDTNVLVASIAAAGVSKEVLQFALDNDEVLSSQLLMEEFSEVLFGKFKFSEREIREIVKLLKEKITVLPCEEQNDPITGVIDQDDWPHLWFCKRVHADVMVTGDKEIVKLRTFKGVSIIRPGEYWEYRKNMI